MFGLVLAVTPAALSAPAYTSAMIWLSGKSAEPITRAPPDPEAAPLLAGAELSGLEEPPQADRARAMPTPAARPPNARLPRARWRDSFMTYLLEQQSPPVRGL